MKSIKLLQKFMCLWGLLGRISANGRQKAFDLCLNCVFFGVAILHFLSTVWFVVFEAQTIAEFSEALLFMLVGLLSITLHLNYVFGKNQNRLYLEDLITATEQRKKHTNVGHVYTNIDKISVKSIDFIILAALKISFPLFVGIAALISAVKYVALGYGKDSFQQAYLATYPFDWRTPYGYLGCISFQAVSVSYPITESVILLSTTVVCCLFLNAFSTDIEINLRELNELAIEAETYGLTMRRKIQMKKKLIDIMQFHSQAKDLADRFGDSFKGVYFTFIAFTLSFICCALLQLDKLLSAGNTVEILRLFVPTITVAFWHYFICYFGTYLTQRFEDIGQGIYNVTWYLLPLDHQQQLPMMIALSQKNVHLRAFANIYCTRDHFKKVMNSAFSYFMMLRKF